ncbi:MAG: isoprenylcysteine carboxylmethyltransferase family protein [Chloroflexi bacterium]|nr:isoprenylcysteine carboxylmethyltransferase family protein [Chloroflexota bacterium]
MSSPLRSLLTLLAGVVLFLGLPIISWGLDDWAGFFAQPAQVGYALVVFAVQILIVWRFPLAGRQGGKGTKLVRQQQIAIVLLQVISLAMVILVPFAARRTFASIDVALPVQVVGLIAFAVGFLLTNWSADVLGRQFSIQVTVQEDHRLVTEGPYQWVRNPRYLGIILFNLGIALVFRSWTGLGLVAALLLVLLWRVHDEEALMRQEFGAQWDAYVGRSWRLVPYLY